MVRAAEEFEAMHGVVITSVISGRAKRGADNLGERFAIERGIPIHPFSPDWEGLGDMAGHLRNYQMAHQGKAKGVVVLWDGCSPGSRNMYDVAQRMRLKRHRVIRRI
jgi:hypothetical protein